MTSRWAERKNDAVALKDEATGRLARARRRWPWLDQPLASYEHYQSINGNAQAAAATYFGVLSFYPLLAIAFFLVETFFPNAEENLLTALNSFLPGVFGEGEGQISVTVFTANATTIGIVGFVGAVYAGLGWLSGVRRALAIAFEETRDERYGFIPGKLRDLLTLAVLGATLMASVTLSGLITTLSAEALESLGLESGKTRIDLLAHAVAILVTTVLILLMYLLLTKAQLSLRAKLYGAVLGGILFEVLKLAAFWVIGSVRDQPAFAVLGISLVLLVWINYFSRILVFAGSWTYMSDHRGPGARVSGLGTDPEEV